MAHSLIKEELEVFDPEKASRRLSEIDIGIGRSRLREVLYEVNGDTRSAEIEAAVQDRLLRERYLIVT